MLKRLLALIAANDGTSSLDELAREIGVPPAMVEQFLTELARMGYLRTAQGECLPVSCAACPLQGQCGPPLGVGLWEVTEKGRRLLAGSPSA
jgi:predicted ArsR family transcriptional regulator